jgi:hypothetical protein
MDGASSRRLLLDSWGLRPPTLDAHWGTIPGSAGVSPANFVFCSRLAGETPALPESSGIRRAFDQNHSGQPRTAEIGLAHETGWAEQRGVHHLLGAMTRSIEYKRTEFLMPWKFRMKAALNKFILDIPYGLYGSVVPSREALNEVLAKGAAGGGMGTGLIWNAFSLTKEEYDDVIINWKSLDLRTVPRFKKTKIPEWGFIFDEDILTIPHHPAYLHKSREKYSQIFRAKP